MACPRPSLWKSSQSTRTQLNVFLHVFIENESAEFSHYQKGCRLMGKRRWPFFGKIASNWPLLLIRHCGQHTLKVNPGHNLWKQNTLFKICWSLLLDTCSLKCENNKGAHCRRKQSLFTCWTCCQFSVLKTTTKKWLIAIFNSIW